MGNSETNDGGGGAPRRRRLFHDRRDAGRQLAPLLEEFRAGQPVVLALPRGGVPVGFEVAAHLEAPLRAFPARKIGAPGQPELGIGAVAPGGLLVLNQQIIRELDISQHDLDLVIARETAEVEARIARYWGGSLDMSLAGRTVILVDDGLATGSTASAALRALGNLGVGQLVLAVPICAAQTADALSSLCDTVVCVLRTDNLSAVGLWYDHFEQTPDEEVDSLLTLSAIGIDPGVLQPEGPTESRVVRINTGDSLIEGDLMVPPSARGIVLFAHGSGSSRHSERNRRVAARLNEARFGTLLVDLLTAQEEVGEQADALKFDIRLLAGRLVEAIDWLQEEEASRGLNIGLFGASTGAAAALLAAVQRSSAVRAVVSRGGRVDLAGSAVLGGASAPTLLIVGEMDKLVLDLNRGALAQMTAAPTAIEIIPGATHLFPEPGALDTVARLAIAWFERYLGR